LAHSISPKHGAAGFTLIEVLVALSIIAVLFSSIAALIVTTSRGSKSVERRLAELETARAIATALPDRDQLVPGTLSGDMAGYQWRVDIAPWAAANFRSRQAATWVPQNVVITVRSPAGGIVQIDTVRLRRRDGT